ncbi:MAG: putative toxin-antitoxin system toxin component, PIN family [Nitrosopumilaceae archaeon]|nr:putative toxin-antitoxin system toxin component, PIN family [Nitrosopumilaceae archaeon]NIU01975.1 putative toxin-antitoxin system toxin component, PIN family [Nitrosopumilaceae archaeon]NIX62576.1 putative toxin-antitoxin system toxin component, PIN family [Nitrosopumilaceae archaeon]
MRVVLDTNVFISSFLGTASPRKVIDLWKEGKITLCLSKEIVDEYVEVLERLGLSREKEVEEILQLFAHNFHSLFTAKTPNLVIVESDPDDNKFFECAVALKAQTIISGDKAVLKVKNYTGIKVLSPKQFLEKL